LSEQPIPKPLPKAEPGFLETPVFQALTIGVPFCIFKLLFGLLIMRAGNEPLSMLAWLVVAWASADLLLNLARAFFHLTGQSSPVEYCTIAQLGRRFNRPRLFLALDTFLAFSIICLALWSGWIRYLTSLESYLWYAATTLNLISLSLVNIWLELRRGG
jgi:hypothetical protein